MILNQEVFRGIARERAEHKRDEYKNQCLAWLQETLISTKVSFDQLPDIEDILEDQDELRPMAAFDCERFLVLVRRYRPEHRLTARNDIRHEAVHVRRFLLNKELYRRIHRRPGAGRFLLAVHNTLLNPLEIEARVFEKTGLLTDEAVDPWLIDNKGICPLEVLISQPFLAATLLERIYPLYCLNNRQRDLISELQQRGDQTVQDTNVLESTVSTLSDTLIKSTKALQETLHNAGIDDILLFQSLFVQQKS